jgi:hypothetical protein
VGNERRVDRRLGRLFLAPVVALVTLTLLLPGPALAAPPTLPLAYDGTLLSNLSAPSLTPGGSGSISFRVADPGSFGSISSVTVTLQVYAFNAYPGNASSTLATAGVPVLVTPSASGTSVNVSLGPLAPGESETASVGVVTSANTPSGDFAVRTALSFRANGTQYLLESRGWFPASVWASATELPGGGTTLNLTVLGVSGVTAETAVLVTSSSWDWALGLILGAGLVLVGLGAFVYFRRERKSSSGAR